MSSSDNLPIIVQVLDQAGCIEAVLAEINPMVKEGLITVEDVELHDRGKVAG